MWGLGLALGLGLAALGGCSEAPEVRYETEHFEIATDFDAPVCAGTMRYFEDHLAFAEAELRRSLPHGTKIRLYWLEDSLGEWCREGATGCFYPGTQVIFAEGKSITHEVIHALLNAEAQTSLFMEEGLAEVYSGVGVRYGKRAGEAPPVAELVWLTTKEYQDRELDYALAGHFAAWLEREFGRATTQRLAEVVIEGGGPAELEAALDRMTSRDIERIEELYGHVGRRTFGGLRESAVPELQFDTGLDLSLDCASEDTLGPLPNGTGGLYRVLRFSIDEPRVLELRLYSGPDVRLDLIDTTHERNEGRVIDFFMPQPSDHIDHPRLTGDEHRELPLTAGTYLLYLSSPGEEAETVSLEAHLSPARQSGFPQ